jgi:hypothetical protein
MTEEVDGMCSFVDRWQQFRGTYDIHIRMVEFD